MIERVSIQTRNNILFISQIEKLKPLVPVLLFLTPRLSFQIISLSRRLDSGEQIKSHAASPKRNTRGDWGETEKTVPIPVQFSLVNGTGYQIL